MPSKTLTNHLPQDPQQESPNIMSECHMNYYTTVGERDIVRNAIVPGYLTFF